MIGVMSLSDFITYAGNSFLCTYKRTIILQNEAKNFTISEIARNRIISSMEEVIKDSVMMEMETRMEYKDGFPHSTYWDELRLYINKYKSQPWELYNTMKNSIGNGTYAAFLRYYAKGLYDDVFYLEARAQEVRI